MPVIVKDGDVLRCTSRWLVHQGNCWTTKPHGLSASIASKWPFANVYAERRNQAGTSNFAVAEDRGIPGTVEIRGDGGGDSPIVVMLLAQLAPGKPGAYYKNVVGSDGDTDEARCKWFQEALNAFGEHIAEEEGDVSFPYGIGCGLAGGNWSQYQSMIGAWSTKYGRHVTLWKHNA